MVLSAESKGLAAKAIPDGETKVQKIGFKYLVDIEHGLPVKTEVEGQIPECILNPCHCRHAQGKLFIPISPEATASQVNKGSRILLKWLQMVLIECSKVKSVPVV